MAWDRFIKKEVIGKESEDLPSIESEYLSSVVTEGNNDYFIINQKRHLLPIRNIVRVTKAQDNSEEYLINNKVTGIILKPTGRIRKFFKIPAVRPESVTYFSDGLIAGISHSREEVISFTVGGPNSDSEFSITNLTVSIRLDNCLNITVINRELYVNYSEGTCVLVPVESY
ncbi:hypothetical protein NEPAR04_0922 [Nematocida parisii]|nr:hypothetical protein NEPAR08_0840 [Nematocida parisii]KAI5127260.1 hypothetical protein NEPAR03_0864 [Nematocida parisii]KAI5141369.1 hypothetical protein NEPAR04_0922 [Nematocida parisii]